MLDTATKNNTDLRERSPSSPRSSRSNGLSTDISQIKGMENPPPVSGQVKKVDPTNKRLEITIGSDDGLVVGHELYLFRTKPRPEYLGKVRSSRSIPTRPSAGSSATPIRARR